MSIHVNGARVNSPYVWDDLRFPATAAIQGQTSEPAYDFTNNGLLFPEGDATEKAHIVAQLPHKWKLRSVLRPHIHFVQSSSNTPTFVMDYRWYKNGGDPTTSFTSITASNFVFDYPGSGSILQITTFPEIDGSDIDTVSSMIDIQIYRNDSDVTGDVLVKEFDIHIPIDDDGSDEEFVKNF